jgi:hypothetical protein
MFAAAVTWLVGLIPPRAWCAVRGRSGSGLHFSHWLAPVVIVAIVLRHHQGALRPDRYADKAVARIEHRGKACFFGFFSVTSWLFVIVMMGGGILLRSTPLVDHPWGRALLSVIYIAVGTGLLIGDRVFWISAWRSRSVPEGGVAK